MAFLGEANGKHAEHVIVSCPDICMSLTEGLLGLRVDLEDTLEGNRVLRRFVIAAKSSSATVRSYSERVVTHVIVSALDIYMSLNEVLQLM